MINILEMLLAFAVLSAVALFFCNVIKVNMGEGMILSASLIVAVLYLFGQSGAFMYGMYLIYSVAILGVIIWIFRMIYYRDRSCIQIFSVSWIVILIVYISSLILYYNDFIQHIDEFHEWAAAVKYMLLYEKMPTGYDFIGGGGQYGFATSLFHLFFQRISGYSEQNMYVSATLLTWLGFLLPFSGTEWKERKKCVIYAVVIYVSLFSLYMYGNKNMYVDMPVAAWAGGLAGWWINRRKKKANILILISGLVMLHFFKQSAGLLMAVFVILFVLLQTYIIEKKYWLNKLRGKKITFWAGLFCAVIIIGDGILLIGSINLKPHVPVIEESVIEDKSVETETTKWEIAGYVLPDRISDRINMVKLSRDKVKLSFGAFATSVFGTPLSSKSNWNLAFLPFVFLLFVLVKMNGELYGEKDECKYYMLYMAFTILSYLSVLFFSYLMMFSYELSVQMRSIGRYFSICAVYLFILVLVVLLFPKRIGREKWQEYIAYALVFFFALGLNKKFIPNSTALQKTEISGYEKISETKRQADKISKVINENDKVYFIYQYESNSLGNAELVNAPALYYMDGQISNYLQLPWRFIPNGCNIQLEEYNTLTIKELPILLAQYGYSYVWIYAADDYLSKELELLLDCDKIQDKALYQVKYENGAVIGLDLICSLKK